LLQAQGHRVHALTLTGVGERAHLLSPDIHLSTHVQDVVAAIDRASRAGSLDDYTNAIADVGELVHDRAYGPGFFSSGALFFLRKGIPDWGVSKSVGRGPLNLSGLATKR
jgi:hypothetical protein